LLTLLKAHPEAAALPVVAGLLPREEADNRQTRCGFRSIAKSKCSQGLYPLQVALFSTTTHVCHLEALWLAHPDIWSERADTLSMLPTLALVAIALHKESRQYMRNKWRRHPSQGLHDWLCQHQSGGFMDNNLNARDPEMECAHLTTLYRILRTAPDALLLGITNNVAATRAATGEVAQKQDSP
jgi:hypothetical protein